MEDPFCTCKQVMTKYGWKSKSNTDQVVLYKPRKSAQIKIKKQQYNDIIRITTPIPNSNYDYTTLLSSKNLNKYVAEHIENYENNTN